MFFAPAFDAVVAALRDRVAALKETSLHSGEEREYHVRVESSKSENLVSLRRV